MKSNKKLLKKYSQDVVGEKQELANLSMSEINQTIAENNNLEIIASCINIESSNISLDRYKSILNLDSRKHDIVEIKKQHNCTIEFNVVYYFSK